MFIYIKGLGILKYGMHYITQPIIDLLGEKKGDRGRGELLNSSKMTALC
jgi:hypothetical protein